jgi:hypothetical protein
MTIDDTSTPTPAPAESDPADEAPLTDDEFREALLDELSGIRVALVSALIIQTLPPHARDRVQVTESGELFIPPPPAPPGSAEPFPKKRTIVAGPKG